MDLILGMDSVVFIAWIGTILLAILCVLYGFYHEFLDKSHKQKIPDVNNKESEKKVEE
jgi:hypothetical protein